MKREQQSIVDSIVSELSERALTARTAMMAGVAVAASSLALAPGASQAHPAPYDGGAPVDGHQVDPGSPSGGVGMPQVKHVHITEFGNPDGGASVDGSTTQPGKVKFTPLQRAERTYAQRVEAKKPVSFIPNIDVLPGKAVPGDETGEPIYAPAVIDILGRHRRAIITVGRKAMNAFGHKVTVEVLPLASHELGGPATKSKDGQGYPKLGDATITTTRAVLHDFHGYAAASVKDRMGETIPNYPVGALQAAIEIK